MAGYTINDVETVKARLRDDSPDCRVQSNDYGLSLSVKHGDGRRALIVFRPPREELSQTEVVTSCVEVVTFLRS